MQNRQMELTRELISQAAQYRPEAVSRIYKSTYPQVYCTIKSLALDENVTRDLVRDTYVTGMQGLRMLRDAAQLPVWIRMVAHSETVAWLAGRSPSLFSRMLIDNAEVPDFEDEFPESLPSVEMEERVAEALLLDLMRNLPEDQRVCTVLYYYERRSVEQIAQELGITQDTVRSRLNYSKWKVKARVREWERNDVKMYGFKTRSAIPFMVFLFRKYEELIAQKSAPSEMYSAIVADLKQAGVPAAEAELLTDAAEEETRRAEKRRARAEKQRRARKRRTRLGIGIAVLVIALLGAGVVYLSVRAHRQRAEQAAEQAAELQTADGTAGGDASGAAGDASGAAGAAEGTGTEDSAAGNASGTASGGTTVSAGTGISDLPQEERIIGIYSEKAHENWMEIAKGSEDDTYEVTFHAKDSKGKEFSETYQARTDQTQLIVDSGTASGTAATLRWSNDYTVSVNESTWFETEKQVTVGGVYLNSETPLRGGSGVDAYLGSWVAMDDSAVDMTLQMSAGSLRMVLYDDNKNQVDHTYTGFEVETGVNGLPSKLRAHISADADETFWLYPDGTITYHSDGSAYNGKNFQQS